MVCCVGANELVSDKDKEYVTVDLLFSECPSRFQCLEYIYKRHSSFQKTRAKDRGKYPALGHFCFRMYGTRMYQLCMEIFV